MQKLADISRFESLANGEGATASLSVFNPVENFDMVSEPNPIPRQDNNPQKAPVTVKTLDARVSKIEQDMSGMKQDIAQINQKLDKLVNR